MPTARGRFRGGVQGGVSGRCRAHRVVLAAAPERALLLLGFLTFADELRGLICRHRFDFGEVPPDTPAAL